jgi:hypothetical protein
MALRCVGVDAVYGVALPGVVTVAAPPASALLLAEAHVRVLRTRAIVHLGQGEFCDVGAHEQPGDVVDVGPELAAAVVATFARSTFARSGAQRPGGHLQVAGALATELGDLATPRPAPEGDRWQEPDPETLAALHAATAPVVLAGPGVLADNEMAGLHGFAAAGSVGVLNTWGAKGVFHWRSRHHLATGGLQARDFELGGLGDADLIIATGLDRGESPDAAWRLHQAIEVPPAALAPLAGAWKRPWHDIIEPPLRTGLAAATQAGWHRSTTPMAPSLVTRNYGAVLGRSGLLAADPGLAGFWAARTFSTTEPGAVFVSGRANADGLAAAAVLVARRHGPARRALAVVDRLSDATAAILELAASMGIALPLEVWDGSGPALDQATHLDRTAALVGAASPGPVFLGTAGHQLAAMVEVAGPVVAWGGLAGSLSAGSW